MAEISKQALKVVNNTNFPNNNSGEISPSDLRSFNVDMIDSLVDELSYNADSASWNSSISALQAFSSSQQPSFAALNAFTASASQSIQALNSFTSSANSRLNSLEAETAALESFTSSINQIQERGVVKGISTRLNFGGGSFVTASIVANVGGAIADITINSDTTKTDTGSFNAYTASTNARINSLEAFTASLDTNYASQAEFNAYTQSNDAKVNAIIAATASFATSAITASSLVTASFDNGTRNLTFTKGDASTFAVNIPDVSGSTFNTGSFATTGSNTFTGVQNFNAAITASNTLISGDLVVNPATSTKLNGNTDIGAFLYINGGLTLNSTAAITWLGSSPIDSTFSASVDARINAITGSGGGSGSVPAGTVSSSAQITDYGIFATLGGNTFTSSQTITTAGNTDVTIQSTAVSGQTNLVLDAFQNNVTAKGNLSFTNNGQFGGSGSVKFISSLNNIEFASDAGTRVGPTNAGGNGINTQAISLQSHSGSLSLAPSGFTNTTASLSHISSSSGTNFVNLIFKNNSNTGTTIVSGSNNIWTNAAAPTATFNRYVGGSQNYYGLTLPQITGSAAFSPSMSNNIVVTGMLLRIPVSSSAYTFSGNILSNSTANGIQLGTAVGTPFTQAVSGLTMTNNNINGSISATAYKTPLSASVSITQNNIGGTATLNMDSSSIQLAGTVQQGQLTINNSYFPSALSASNAAVGTSAILSIGGSTIFASGSNTTFPSQRTIVNSAMIGGSNVISASLNGNNAQIHSTILLGQSLIALGTNTIPAGATAADWGSVYVGRWNAIDGTKDQTAETVFAVGTGTGTAARKTGFLIDSGSNTFVEGTLNVSGSTSLSGSLSIQSGSAFPQGTGSALLAYNQTTGEVTYTSYQSALPALFDVGAFYSTVTQSGSANVSGAFQFDNTVPINSINITSGSHINLANTDVAYYNLQFSIQAVQGSGEGNLAVWLKKNGVNVPNTATYVTIASNHKDVIALNLWDSGSAGDYFELAYQSDSNNTTYQYIAPTGNIPASPSIILTVNQIR